MARGSLSLGDMLSRILPLSLLASLAVLLAQEHAPEREKNPFAGSAAASASGGRLYSQACQSCHGGGGRGGDRGPALNTGVFTRGGADGEIFLTIRNGVRGTQMPGFGGLKTEQLWHLVTYIRSLNSNRPASAPDAQSIGDPTAGAALFFGKAGCAGCHEVNARGVAVGPDLSGAGRFPAELLRRKITDPNAEPSGQGRSGRRQPGIVRVMAKDGREYTGLRRAEDSFSLMVMEQSGHLLRFDKSQLAEVSYEYRSLMPAARGLSADEIGDLVAFLKTQNGRDLAATAQADISGGLTWARLRNAPAEPANWLTYWGNNHGHHYSALKEITTANAGSLQARWAAQMPGDSIIEATPLVIDGIMYTAGSPGEVFALDARTGLQIWKYERRQKTVNPYESNRYSRGVAVLGNRVFFGTLDAVLIALDARTGLPLWETQVADTMKGYSITASPLVVKDKLIVGVAGGEYGAPGFLDAYDPATGKRIWRFNMVPQPGEFGHDTWPGDTWKRGAGATWLTGSYDAELDTLYWAVGNPGPDLDPDVRKGDNLYTDAVVALDPNTGRRKWHYQFTPNDSHDWDANQDLVLIDRPWQGQPRKLLVQANRNGFYYVLDRTDGKFLMGRPFVKQTWNVGFDEGGRPIMAPNSQASTEGAVVYPSLGGGTNWQAPSYDPTRGWLYVATNEAGQRYIKTPEAFEAGKQYWSGRGMSLDEAPIPAIKAIDAVTGEIKWQFRIAQGSNGAGVLATGGGTLFAATREGNLIAFDAGTGKVLWRFQTGATIATAPMSYAVDGKQYVAVGSGGVLYCFALPDL